MTRAFLTARRPSAILDAVRVPYALDAAIAADVTGPAGTLSWPSTTQLEEAAFSAFRVEDVEVFASLLDEQACARILTESGGGWMPTSPVVDSRGSTISAIWRRAGGDVYLPFDPDDARASLLDERYLEITMGATHHRLRGAAQNAYYRARRLIPRRLQMAMRRRYLAAQNLVQFPGWPIETALHDLDALVLGLVETIAGEPLPWIAPWPDAYDWAFVLTHDVETAAGYARLEAVLEREVDRGLRSACYFVPERDYSVDAARLENLRENGFEIGLHGLRHDGRDLSRGDFEERLPAMRRYAEAWGAVGFRSPSTHRDRDRLSRLELAYDSTYSDVARFEPQPGGSCSWLPFFIGSLVELPITMPMDHLIFELFGDTTDELWATKGEALRRTGGMALLLTHPDYMLDDGRLDVYAGLLDRWADDESAWRALPCEVARWWQERAECRLERDGKRWRGVGEGATRARVISGAPKRPTPAAGEARWAAVGASLGISVLGCVHAAAEAAMLVS